MVGTQTQPSISRRKGAQIEPARPTLQVPPRMYTAGRRRWIMNTSEYWVDYIFIELLNS